ncbi:hypothetical protein [Methylosinus sporium]|uniref:hypothetical protein n=1 Tax=Methylosinus sporium TaxID=428 RepID=UPI00383BDA3B
MSRAFDSGDLRQLAGVLRFVDGNTICDPWSLSSLERFIVPDVEDEKALAPQPVARRASQGDALRIARYFRAGALHAGVERMEHDFDGEIARVLRELVESRWMRTAERLESWRHNPRDAAVFWRAAIIVEALRDR